MTARTKLDSKRRSTQIARPRGKIDFQVCAPDRHSASFLRKRTIMFPRMTCTHLFSEARSKYEVGFSMKTVLDNEAAVIAGAARALTTNADYDSLVEMAGEPQCVLIGEASHGTHEFYAIRTALTRRLIEEKGFRAVALEADWPDSFRVHRFVTGRSDDKRASEALNDFRRFPSWMWRNTVVVDFIEWLRQWNAHNEDNLAGFYGLDLYSMHTSIAAVVNSLDKIDPAAAQGAQQGYACVDHFGVGPRDYGLATVAGRAEPCEDDVVAQLTELRRKYAEYIQRDGHIGEEEFFSAEQNARLVMNAERYYRAMFHG